jgi:hypothetical protein
VLKVKVEDVQLTYVKPKVTQTLYQYIILCSDEHMHSEVFIVDAEKFDRKKVEELIKQKYASRYRIPTNEVEVSWIIEPPKLKFK